ncbi:Ig-like domain-containing protein [uncultured Treponema sp.]|uniref:Ig-like domain-containing protein n=1 Tax=uncultured Treponema sp. TaxID=162155 RepID=UPI0025EAC46C|nr:Ig-like domain-containing protein [uncultured Treponema sp.]
MTELVVNGQDALSPEDDAPNMITGALGSGRTRWVKFELLADDAEIGEGAVTTKEPTVLGSKTLAVYPIPTGEIEADVEIAVKQYKATVNVTSFDTITNEEDQKVVLTMKDGDEVIKTIELTESVDGTVDSKACKVFSEYVPVGTYTVTVGNGTGSISNATALTVDASKVLKSISAKWKDSETQPLLYAGLSDEDLLKKITIVETYNDNSTNDVDSPAASVADYDPTSTQAQSIKISYNGKETALSVTLTAVALESIAIDESSAHKTEFTVGDELDLTGLVLSLTYNDTSKNTTVAYSADNATDFVATGFDSTNPAESQTVTITYGGKNATIEVVIKKPFIENKMYLVTAGNSDVKITLDETENSATLGSYVLSGFNKQNDVIVFNQNLMDENITSAKISAVVNWKSTSGHIGLGLLNLLDSLYTDTAVVSNAGIFATAQGIKGWGSSGLFSSKDKACNASTTKDYLIEIEYEKTETGFTLKFTSTGENGTSATFTESNFTFPSGKPVYFAVGASPTGTSNPKSDNIVYRDIKVTLSGNGIEKSGDEQTVTSVEKTLLTDSRTSLTASTSDVSYTIPSTVTNSNKGDSYKITLANVSLDSVKALAGETEVEGAWAWDSTDVTLATGASSVKAKATFTPTDTTSYKSIVSKEFTINVTDERAEKPEDAKVDVTWNFAAMSDLSVYTTATPDSENNKVTYSGNDESVSKHYFVSTSPSMALVIAGTYRDNGNSVQIGAGSFIYVPVSAGSELTVTGYSGYTNYTVTLADGKTENVTDASAKTYTAKTAGFAKIEGGDNGYIVSIAVKDITRADIVAFYGSEPDHIATFPTADEPTISISGDDSVTLAGEGEEAATIQLTANVTNAGNATVVWSSSADSIATVDQTGKVTAVAEGEVTITAKITVEGTDYSAEKSVSVTKGGVVYGQLTFNSKIENTATDYVTITDASTDYKDYKFTLDGSSSVSTVTGYLAKGLKINSSAKFTMTLKQNTKCVLYMLQNNTQGHGFKFTNTEDATKSYTCEYSKNNAGLGVKAIEFTLVSGTYTFARDGSTSKEYALGGIIFKSEN